MQNKQKLGKKKKADHVLQYKLKIFERLQGSNHTLVSTKLVHEQLKYCHKNC